MNSKSRRADAALLIQGPGTNRAQVNSLTIALGIDDIPVLPIDLTKPGVFQCSDDYEIVMIIIAGNPKISIRGLQELYSETPIVVMGHPSPDDPPTVTYALDAEDAYAAVKRAFCARLQEAASRQLDGISLADEIEPVEGMTFGHTGPWAALA